MKKRILISFLAIIITVCSLLLPNQTVLAAGAELPKDFNQDITPYVTTYDIIVGCSKYSGNSVSHEYNELKGNGDRYYYEGTLYYIGKDGIFGDYMYLGDKREFVLYKVVKADGTIITPNSIIINQQ